MNPDWIEAVRESWTKGEDIDIHALEIQYKLATLYGLKICITGFSDRELALGYDCHHCAWDNANQGATVPFRSYMQKTTEENGAEYRKDLTKSVTHLIARNSDGEKYKFATQWNIKVVSVKWFTDSIERGMILGEETYHPLVPLEEQGLGAWNRTAPMEREPSKKPATKENPMNPRPRKLRRIASTKLVDQNESIWGDIVGTGFDNIQADGPKTTPQGRGSEPPKPVIQAYQSFASETTFSENTDTSQKPTKPSKDNGFLHETYFFITGFSPKQVCAPRLCFPIDTLVNIL
jgi:DNA replication regulator DPB11